jgi:hypothetical protein
MFILRRYLMHPFFSFKSFITSFHSSLGPCWLGRFL